MDIFLLILGLVLMIVGIVGSFLPVLPGIITSWVGLLLIHLTSIIPLNWTFLGVTLGIALILWLLDYFIPAIATKRFGGSKYGVYGTTVGLIIGLIAPIPFGVFIGAFLGAFIGEIIHDNKNRKRALKASVGSLLGFLASTAIEFAATMVFLVLFIIKFWEYKGQFF